MQIKDQIKDKPEDVADAHGLFGHTNKYNRRFRMAVKTSLGQRFLYTLQERGMCSGPSRNSGVRVQPEGTYMPRRIRTICSDFLMYMQTTASVISSTSQQTEINSKCQSCFGCIIGGASPFTFRTTISTRIDIIENESWKQLQI